MRKPRPFDWTPKTERAAELVAEGELTQDKIAEAVGVTRNTLYVWRQNPEFEARVEEHLFAFRMAVRKRGVAILERRVNAVNDRWMKMQQVIAERASDPTMAAVPGGTTGLLVHDIKSVGVGPAAMTVDLYEVDTGLLRELREHEKQAAQELGQWTEKQSMELGLKEYAVVNDPKKL